MVTRSVYSNDELVSFYNDLAAKTIDYKIADKFDVGYYSYQVTAVTGPVVGKADDFAVCYTSPKIEVVASDTEFGYNIKCEIDYGVYPINAPAIFQITTA